ncbi:hypothetical protein HAT93_03230 [Dickeya solani]|nr:hypothetical protein [Dickeya solani]
MHSDSFAMRNENERIFLSRQWIAAQECLCTLPAQTVPYPYTDGTIQRQRGKTVRKTGRVRHKWCFSSI